MLRDYRLSKDDMQSIICYNFTEIKNNLMLESNEPAATAAPVGTVAPEETSNNSVVDKEGNLIIYSVNDDKILEDLPGVILDRVNPKNGLI